MESTDTKGRATRPPAERENRGRPSGGKMRSISIGLVLLLLAATQSALCQEPRASSNGKIEDSQALTTAETDAVEQAIVDEIYANHLQGFVADIGKDVSGSKYEIRGYFKPTLNADKAGWVIYKLMPYGEVLRMFTLRNDGLAVLFGKLRDHFPPTQPSYLTVYMDDDELCRLKKEWKKEEFTVDLKPPAHRVAEAVARQRKTQSP